MTKPTNPALVLVHGLGSAGNIWKSLPPNLVNDFTVYSIDLPGHGEAQMCETEKYDPRSLGQMILRHMQEIHNLCMGEPREIEALSFLCGQRCGTLKESVHDI